MGVFSQYHRYRDAGEDANIYNVSNFGQPAYSLFTSTKILTLHNHIDITDANEQVMYQSNSKMISIHNKTQITDKDGNVVADIQRKVFTIHARHTVSMADGTYFEITNELLHIVKEVTNIEGLGWQLRGNIAELNFQLYDQNDNIIAVIGQKMISIHDKFCIDIYQPQYEKYIVAILITLELMLRDRANARAAISSSSN